VLTVWPPSDIAATGLLVAAPIAASLLAWRVSSQTRRVSEGLRRGILAGCVTVAIALAVLSTGQGAAGLEVLAEIFVGGLSVVFVVAGSAVASAVAASSAAVHGQQRPGR
jgi:hypothetical protein